ncbi:flagellar biosynthetic protein FliQ [Clostridium acidisoli DSM 12555]|jgi:flagellar biosynthetic protein FliQ|uniref:Flagellar biosynthetic protein FliQ n=1 Tax=Clostridium acidisoli DSM 12555 TaxID=1121291 RepID=A0A1W1X1F7_9CLOT|nr:flagellar biosynthesis protein FliQ [Clostridium acidisoli]SMC17799.1 flagellar biosynthetic protein FliQ [Clostridium acidisoli DSM 12555]
MTENMLLGILKDGITTGLMVAAPFLIVAVIVGLIISIFQATTQIQEQTLTFVPKLLAIAVIGILTSTWMLHMMTGLTDRIFDTISNITR